MVPLDTWVSLAAALRDAGSAIDALLARRLRPVSITFQHVRALDLVSTKRAATAASLSSAMGITTGPMTRMLDRLEEKGWLVRRRDDGDRRIQRLEMTPSGYAILALAKPIVATAWHDATGRVSSNDLLTVEHVLVALALTAGAAR